MTDRSSSLNLPSRRDERTSKLPFIPSFFGDESLYSWSARYHLLSGNTRAIRSSEELFQDKRAGLRHDFPFQLSNFYETTGGLLGSSQSIMSNRTLFGFFAPFLDAQVKEKISAQMLGNATTTLKRSLGLIGSRVGATHPLKACHQCIKEDLRQYGVTTWKMEHQWPSVWVCRRHFSFLYTVDVRFQVKDPRKWVLPDELMSKDWHRITFARKHTAQLVHLADVSADLVERFQDGVDPDLLRVTYLYALRMKGLVATDGSIRFQQLRESFWTHYKGFKEVPGFGLISSVQSDHGGLLGLVTRQYQGQRHPLKHLLLIAYLFQSGKEFRSEYQKASDVRAALTINSSWRTQEFNQEWKSRLRCLVETNRLSVSEAARQLNVPLPQAIRFVRNAGIPYAKRPRVLNPQLEKSLHNLALQGVSYQEMADLLHVKKSFVRSFMARNKALRAQWHCGRKTAKDNFCG